MESFYREMNVDHLFDDELEHELMIRGIPIVHGESRDVMKRKLRNILKLQRENNEYSVTSIENSEEISSELEIVTQKVAKLKEMLENKRIRKEVQPLARTRLLHLHFRLQRLSDKVDAEEVLDCIERLMKEYFPQKQQTKSSERNLGLDISSDEEIQESEEESRAVNSEPVDVQSNQQDIRNPNPMIAGMDVKQFMEGLTKLVEETVTQKFKELQLTAKTQKDQWKGETEKEDRKKEQEHLTRRRETQLKDEEEESEHSEGEIRTGKRRPRSVVEWKFRYDGKDEGRRLNKFIEEVEFMAEAEGFSTRDLYREAFHLFGGDARTWYMNAKKNGEFEDWAGLIAELKLEFQSPDLDIHYEQQAVYRKQRNRENLTSTSTR